MKHRVVGDAHVGQEAVRADPHVVAQAHVALEDAVDVDLHVLAAGERAAHVEARRVRQPHALLHQRAGLAQLVGALELRQLQRAVDAVHFHRLGGRRGHHRAPVRHRELHDVGEVVLLLRVVVGQAREPGFQLRGGHGHEAGVDLADPALLLAGILVLHDRLDRVAAPHDAPVARGVGHLHGQQREPLAAALVHQRLQGLGRIRGTSPLRISAMPSSGSTGTTCCTAWPVPSCGSCRTKSGAGAPAAAPTGAARPRPRRRHGR
jgi:hypothetical protein